MSRTPARPYSAQEAASLLGISSSRLRRHLTAGRAPGAYKIGRDWLIPASALTALRAWAAASRNAGRRGQPTRIG